MKSRPVAIVCVVVGCLFATRSASAAETYRWGNVAILGGGFVSGIVTHPAEKGLIYCRTDIGGAYRWDEPAKRWIPITDWVGGPDWNYTGIESLAIDPSDPNRVYLAAGTYTNNWARTNGAIFRSNDRGKTWQKSDLPFKNGGNEEGRNAGERLMVDPTDGNVIYFGTRNNGLWRSTDAGATWRQVESFPIKSKANVPSTSSGQAPSTNSGQGASTGSGQAPSTSSGRGIGLVFVAFDKANRGTIYVGVSDKTTSVYRSTDNGNAWEPIAGQLLAGSPSGMLPNHGVVFPDGSLWVTYANAPGPNGMTDGAVWKFDPKAGSATGAWSDVSPRRPSADDKFGYAGITFDPRKPGTIIISTMDRWAKKDTLFRSTDGGKTWNSLLAPDASDRPKATFDHSNAPYTKDMTPHWTGDVEIDPADSDHVMFVTGYGIWSSRNVSRSDSGESTHWTFDNEGLEECVINDVISPPSTAPDAALVLCAMWDLDGFRHVSLDRSPPDGSFEPRHGRTTGMDFAQLDPNLIVRVYGLGDRTTHGSYSIDNGRTWTQFARSADRRGDGTIAVSADGATFVWATEAGGAYWSRDRGSTWTASNGISRKLRVRSDRADANTFYAFDHTNGTMLVSADGGATFSAAATGLPAGDEAQDFAAVPGKPGNVWLCTETGLFRSTDAGRNFQKIERVQKASRIGFGKAAAGSDHPAVFLVGTIDGVYGFYRSDDAGRSWLRINDDQHQFAQITSIAGDLRTFGRVYLGSASRGVIYGEPAGK